VPRKFSKTTSAASLTVWDMLFGDENAQSYVAANSYKQAQICFKEIKSIMKGFDAKGRHFKVNREEITFRNNERDSSITCLSGDAKTKDGLMASLAIIDEYAQARNTATKRGDDLKNTLTTSMGTRREPLTVVITTASDVLDGPFYEELNGVKRILRGEMKNDTIFASLFMPDPNDREDDPATWRKVQPHLGVTVNEDFYEKEYADAQVSETKMVAFRNKLLNVFAVNENRMWFTSKKAKELIGSFDIDMAKGVDCAVSFDLSTRDDFSAVSYTVYSTGLHKFYVHTDYYFPEGSMEGHPNQALYRKWAEEGHLRLCKGERIDVLQIAADINRRSKNVTIIGIAYDSYKAPDLVNTLIALGAAKVLHPYKQTQGSFNLPVEAFEMLAYAEPPKVEMNDNPINVYCLTNCVIDEDRLGNKKPFKVSQYRKIDGTITLLMTLGEMYAHER
jgi:phage terminase large subunit-like protein